MHSLNGHRLGVLSVRAFNQGKGAETRANSDAHDVRAFFFGWGKADG